MLSAGLEPTISAIELQTYIRDRTATKIGGKYTYRVRFLFE
jgi:hypothetical protein